MIRRREFLASVGASLVGYGVGGQREAVAADEAARRALGEKYHIVDTHLHLFNSTLQKELGDVGLGQTDATIEGAVAAMKRGGVDKAFLITYNAQDIARQFRQRNIDPARARLVFNTKYQRQALKRHPDLFYWFPDHNDPLRETDLEDLERNFEAGATGIKLLPVFHGFFPDHPGYMELYEVCRKWNKPVVLDSSWWYFDFMPPYNETKARRKLVTRCADYCELMAKVFKAFPTVAFSLAHAGAAKTTDDYPDIFALIADHPNVSCDLAAARGYSAEFIQQAVKAVGARKVMYGTDWPYWSSGVESFLSGSRRWTMLTEDCPNLDEEAIGLILGENAERFTKNELPGLAPDSKKKESAQQSRAERLHRESVVVVIHDHNPIVPDVAPMLAGGVTAKVYQLLIDVEPGRDFRASGKVRAGWMKKGLAEIKSARREIDADPERLMLALTAADFETAKQEGKVAVMFGVEGAKLLEGKLETLKTFYDLGLRELQLRWAVPNQIVERKELTAFGVEVIRECQRLGIIVDLTHIPWDAFYQAIDLLDKPPIVSHGSAAGAGIGQDDRSLKALAARRGVLGIHFYSSYLGKNPTVERVVDHIEYITQLVGIETVGLGVDFFPSEGVWREYQLAQGTRDISWAIEHLGQMRRVTDALVARKFSDDDIRNVLGGNFLRVCREVFGA
jgi:membrane dipeptidase